MPISRDDFDALIAEVIARHGEGGRAALVSLLRVASTLDSGGGEPALMRLAGLAFDACEEIAEGGGPSDPGPGEGSAHWEARLRGLAGRAEADQLPLQLVLDGLAHLAGSGAESWFLSEFLGESGESPRPPPNRGSALSGSPSRPRPPIRIMDRGMDSSGPEPRPGPMPSRQHRFVTKGGSS
jgi:hypothetical protein